MACNIFGMI